MSRKLYSLTSCIEDVEPLFGSDSAPVSDGLMLAVFCLGENAKSSRLLLRELGMAL